jgi:uncharacterized protein (TIGR02145 family)
VGTGLLTYTGSFALIGAQAGNYILSVQPTVAASIIKANTNTTLTSSLNPSGYGQSVTFTATVTGAVEMPAGMIEFRDGSTILGTGTLDSSGIATLTITTLSADMHHIVAYYLGNIHYNPSNSNTLLQDVICPSNFADHEGNDITVTRLAGLCWTSNMENRTYAASMGSGVIPFAHAYYCPRCPDSTALANVYGLLYDWFSAVGEPSRTAFVQGVCPDGWHIPTQIELLQLTQYSSFELISSEPAHWVMPGSDDYSFTVLPAGIYESATHRFIKMHALTGFWSCDAESVTHGYWLCFNYSCEYITNNVAPKKDGMSVRCVLNDK